MKISDSSSDTVRNLFNLNKNEKIFDDFGCSLVEKINSPGRIYLTENNICFDSNVFSQIKLKFPMNEIVELKKNKQTIEFKVTKQKKNIYKFTSFKNFKISYQRIKSICKNFLVKNKKKNFNILLSEDEEDDESSDSEISNNNNNINTNNNNNINNNNNNIVNNNNNNIINNNNNNNETNQKSDLIKKNSNNNFEEKNSSKNLNENLKKSNSNSSNNINEDIPNDFKFTELDPSFKFQFPKFIINLSLENFFEKYLSNNPETSYAAYYESLSDHFEINVSNWESENEEKKETKSRLLDFKIKLTGVPFINQSHVKKKQILNKTPDLITICGTSTNSGIPYSDYFEICDIQEFYAFGPNKTIFNMVSKVNFLKSTMLKGTFEKTTKNQYQNEINGWVDFMKKNGEKVEIFNLEEIKKKISHNFENKSSNNLSHGLEKVGYYNNNNNNDIKEIILNYIFQDLKKEFINKINTKNIWIIFIFFFLFIIIFHQIKEIHLLKQNLIEINLLKKNLEEMKIIIKNIKNKNN